MQNVRDSESGLTRVACGDVVRVRVLHCAFGIVHARASCAATAGHRPAPWSPQVARRLECAGNSSGRELQAAAERAAPARRVVQGRVRTDVTLGEYFGRKPVVLAFVYYQCPMLCPQVMNGISSRAEGRCRSRRARISTSSSSASIRGTRRRRPTQRSGRISCTGRHGDGRRLAPAYWRRSGDPARHVGGGIHLKWDEATGSSRTSAACWSSTPDGRLSRYFYGVEYLAERSAAGARGFEQGHVSARSIDELLLYCFHYDPASGRYGATVMNLVRLGGVLTVRARHRFLRADAAARIAPIASRTEARLSYLCCLGFRCFPNRRRRSPPT